MPTSSITFEASEGGYNGSNALIDNSNEFYLDLGKDESYAILILSDVIGSIPSFTTINSINVIIKNARYEPTSPDEVADGSTFVVSLYHSTTSAFTSGATVSLNEGGQVATDLSVTSGGGLWGKTWTSSDLSAIAVRLSDPTESDGVSVALRATFVKVELDYSTASVGNGKIKLTSGKLIIPLGKVTL